MSLFKQISIKGRPHWIVPQWWFYLALTVYLFQAIELIWKVEGWLL